MPIAIRFNTDRFTDDLKKEIKKLLKVEENQVAVRGPILNEFEEWIKKEIPEANKNKDGYYTTKKMEE